MRPRPLTHKNLLRVNQMEEIHLGFSLLYKVFRFQFFLSRRLKKHHITVTVLLYLKFLVYPKKKKKNRRDSIFSLYVITRIIQFFLL